MVVNSNCSNAGAYIEETYLTQASMQQSTNEMLVSICNSLGFQGTTFAAVNGCVSNITNTLAAVGMGSIEVSSMAMTSIMMNTFVQLRDMYIDGTTYQLTGNTMSRQSQGILSYFATMAPVLKGMLTAITLLMVPITALLLPTAIFGRVLAFTASGFLTLSLWNVIDAGLYGFLMGYANSLFSSVRMGKYGLNTMVYFMPDATSQAYNVLAGMTMGGFAMASGMSAAIFKMGGGVVAQLAADAIRVGTRDSINSEHKKWDGSRLKDAAHASGEAQIMKEGMAQGMTGADMARRRAIAQGISQASDAFKSMARSDVMTSHGGASVLGGAAGELQGIKDAGAAQGLMRAKQQLGGNYQNRMIDGAATKEMLGVQSDVQTREKMVDADLNEGDMAVQAVDRSVGNAIWNKRTDALADQMGVPRNDVKLAKAMGMTADKAYSLLSSFKSNGVSGAQSGNLLMSMADASRVVDTAAHLEAQHRTGGDIVGLKAQEGRQRGARDSAGVVATGSPDNAARMKTKEVTGALADTAAVERQNMDFLKSQGLGNDPRLINQGKITPAGMLFASKATSLAKLSGQGGADGLVRTPKYGVGADGEPRLISMHTTGDLTGQALKPVYDKIVGKSQFANVAKEMKQAMEHGKSFHVDYNENGAGDITTMRGDSGASLSTTDHARSVTGKTTEVYDKFMSDSSQTWDSRKQHLSGFVNSVMNVNYFSRSTTTIIPVLNY